MAQRFDGQEWSVTPVQKIGTFSSFWSVGASSSTEAWAAGITSSDGTSFTVLLERWDGDGWSSVRTRLPSDWVEPRVYGIDSRSPTDAWAVGSHQVGSVLQAFVEHWDGKRWTAIEL